MKAILVIDMPNMCWECPLCHNDCVCDIIGDVTDDDSVDVRCPLKPMPQKKIGEILIKGNTAELVKAYRDGWNDCIDEILGGNE